MVWDERGPVSWPHLLLAFPSIMLQAHLCWQEEGKNEPGIGFFGGGSRIWALERSSSQSFLWGREGGRTQISV